MRLITNFLFILILYYDNYSQWTELHTGVTVSLNSLHSIKNLTTWVCGNNGTILKSFNNGELWENANLSYIPFNVNLFHIYCINENKVFVCGNDEQTSYLYKTTNSGESWLIVHNQPNGKFNALHFIDENTGYLTGNPVYGRWSIWKTTNGGNSWDSAGLYIPQLNNESGFHNALWASMGRIWIGTNNYKIYKTSNYGNSWHTINIFIEKDIRTLWFDYDYNIGYTGSIFLLKTTNSGFNWFTETLPGLGNIISVTGTAHSRINWAIRSDGNIYVKPYNEFIWRYDYTPPAGNYNYITIEKNGYFSGYVFAIRDNGGISRTSFLTIGIEPISQGIPKNFKLYQNFPNPFNPITKIQFDVKKKAFITLNIYDINGKLVENLVSEELSAGKYRINWNAERFSSGIFFCKFIAQDYLETQKLILLK
jgi:photosystem II stability/assembly factor-like uncharacterized protein